MFSSAIYLIQMHALVRVGLPLHGQSLWEFLHPLICLAFALPDAGKESKTTTKKDYLHYYKMYYNMALCTAALLRELQPAPLFPVFHYWTNW